MNVTAFMNLMVVLVPFLLLTAVFSRMAVLELNLPAHKAEQGGKNTPSLSLEIELRKDFLRIGDAKHGTIRTLKATQGKYNLKMLSELLQQIKVRYPTVTAVNILCEPYISYDTLVQVMDTVRMVPVKHEGRWVNAELFPDIAIGDVPAKTP